MPPAAAGPRHATACRAALAAMMLLLTSVACTPRTTPAPTTPALVVAARDTASHDTASRDTLPPWPRGEVRTVRFWSPSLGAHKRYRVWLPPQYARDVEARFPVALYLHGLFGDEANWFAQGALPRTLDSLAAAGQRPMIVVTPDGDDGWYTTWNRLVDAGACRRARERQGDAESYCVPWARYDEYVARDVVAHVDSTLRTRASRAHRAIAGLSMGGYGAVTLALRYPDLFAAAASHSGVLSPMLVTDSAARVPRYATSLAELRRTSPRLVQWLEPAFGSDTTGWWARDPARLARAARDGGRPLPALRFDSGVEDRGIIEMNRAFHHELAALGIAHEWAERPGRHDWTYWRTNAPASLAWLAGIIGAP